MSDGHGRPPVAVVMGGPSAEHDVSLVSGRAIAAGLAEQGHEVQGWLVDLAGRWWRLPATGLDGDLPPTAFDDPAVLGAEGPAGAPAALERLRATGTPPVVFIALHGPFGEDGTIQALLEAGGLVYTGAGVTASAMGMDKALFKRFAAGCGLPVVPWRPIEARLFRDDRAGCLEGLAAFARGLADRRLIVKPARLGSSIGMTIVHRPDDAGALGSALEEALAYDDLALAEEYLAGARELEVSAVGNGEWDLAVYGPGEVFPGREFYDYEAKYRAGVSRTTDRPELAPTLRRDVLEISRRIYLALGVTGFARVDFLVRGEQPYLSEINTIPGFTPISLFPVLCAEGGHDLGGIASRIVHLALERAALRPHRQLTRADLP